ncbi:MAG: TetR/AcrR family transcriptional regulator [Emcibacter sp.]|nr:TetR/AcrR family transcriptional regulator [Emcibacter sp.]
MTKNRYRRDELLEIAIDLFAEKGYVGTSIRDIAKAIDRSVSNVYHYFENKEELWLAILEYSVQGLPEKLRMVAHGEGEPLERFKKLLKVHLEESTKHQRETKIFFIDEERLSPKGKIINKQIQKEILDIYVEQFRLLQSHNLVRARNLKILAFNVLATINWFLRWYDPEGNMSKEEIYDEIIDFVLHGMCTK